MKVRNYHIERKINNVNIIKTSVARAATHLAAYRSSIMTVRASKLNIIQYTPSS